MSTSKFLGLFNGAKTLYTAIVTSAGVADASKIAMTGSDGRFSLTLMPTGLGPTTSTAIAAEALSAGDLVNIYDVSGVATCRKADCSNGRSAHGFILAAFANAATVTIYTSGLNTSKTGLVAGTLYFLGTSGATVTVPPGNATIIQEIGVALSSGSLPFDYDAPTTVA